MLLATFQQLIKLHTVGKMSNSATLWSISATAYLRVSVMRQGVAGFPRQRIKPWTLRLFGMRLKH